MAYITELAAAELAALGTEDASFVASQLEQTRSAKYEPCDNSAPYIFYVDHNERAHIAQGNCHHWTCSRCGQLRALEEYGRIVSGARELADAGHDLYFLTLTCRGRDMPLDVANRDYYRWTSRLLDTARHRARREGASWHYAQVTERQARGHPHSHLLTTYRPPDATPTSRYRLVSGVGLQWRSVLASDWLQAACQRAGLGPQYELTPVRNPLAVAVYIGKYLFKHATMTEWPKGWRRIRYSAHWPKLPFEPPLTGWPLLKLADWERADRLGKTIHCDSELTYLAALARRITSVLWLGEG